MVIEPDISLETCLLRMADLEARLQESTDTLDAIRAGEIDAVVISVAASENRIYTLENADRPYRVMIEQIQEGAVTLSIDGTILYCNRRLAEMLGLPQERVIGHTLEQFLPMDETATFLSLVEAAASGPARDEFTLHTANGQQTPVYISLSPLHQDEGDLLLCGVLADLTQQKQHVHELAVANKKLTTEIAQRESVEDALRQSQKMEAVGQLTGGLAHDFNNLLTGITGSLQMMRTRIAQGRGGELEKYINAATSSADRAAALTHRLLAFSRRQTLDPKPVQPNQLVSGMMDLLRRTVGPAVKIDTVLAQDAGLILCDPNQLENAILNLAINARDAMPDGGHMTIETENSDIEPMFAMQRDMTPGRYVTIAVSDTGIGMSPEIVKRAFDPFFTTKPIGQGTGLGLSMIYGFSKQSGGQVRIHSEEGLGTTVRIHFPLYQGVEAPEEETEISPDAMYAEAGETVLVVDDEPIVRMLVVELLQELGYAALEADDGREGMRHIDSKGRIDLLVTDVGLPGGMNGRQFADLARARRKGLKVLFITGFADVTALGSETMEAGMEVLTKPFAMDALAAKIRSLIEEK